MAVVQVTEELLLAKAREVFGIREFRPGQRELLAAVLGGRDAVGVLPTGGGKSLVYQLASLYLPRPVVVVRRCQKFRVRDGFSLTPAAFQGNRSRVD